MKYRKSTGLFGGLVLGLAFSAGANAQDNELDFEIVDTDGDACVTWEELRNRSMDVWGAMDLNDDGLIAGEELPSTTNEKGETVRPAGSIDLTKFQAAMYDAFQAADKDKDGCLSKSEFDEG